MLQSEELDRDGFEEILQRAVGKIPKMYPNWNDFNPSDPGIMLLELMSYYTEVSEYHLNVVDEDNYKKYLKLLGKSPCGRIPARSWLKVTGTGRLLENSVFYAEDIPFETEHTLDISENEIISIKNGETLVENKNNLFGDLHSQFVFLPFEDMDEDENLSFEIELKRSLSQGNIVGVYFQLKEWKNTAPFRKGFGDYVKYHCEVFSDGWKDGVEILVDETEGLCRSGNIILKITKKINISEGRKLRFVIDEGRYPIKPVITGILWNVVSARQKATHTDSIELGMDYGICNQRMKFEVNNCIPQSIKLFVLEKNGRYQWEWVESFDYSDPSSRHFMYDEKNGAIIFGDGVRGRAPKGSVCIGEYAVSFGVDGNIKESVLTGQGKFNAVNILPAYGGRNPQSIEECFDEIRSELEIPKRCVTLSDYEKAVKNTPGVPVHRVKAFRSTNSENTICIAVEGEGENRELEVKCIDNLKKYVLPKALIGTNVEFVRPKYTRIYIFLEASVHPYYEHCEDKTIDALKKYFDSEGISFGDAIKGNQVINYLYNLPWIKGIRNLEMSSNGNRLKSSNGRDVSLGDDCLPYVDGVNIHIIS